MGATKKYEVYRAVTLQLDTERSPFRYKRGSREALPFGEIFFVKKKISQEQATKACARVNGLSAVVTATRIQLSTTSAVEGWNDAMATVDCFVVELNKLLRSRDRTVAVSRARKAGSRTGYFYSPPGRT